MKRTDFLDIAFDIQNGTYAPFRKKNNEVKYVHTESNHPKTTLRQIPKMVSKRLSNRSINKDEFDKISGEYNNALAKSGYKEKILYETKTVKNKKNRKRNIIWFNPPFCKSVQTNVARKFLTLIRKHFNKSHALYKIFNKNSINVSYSCLPNIGQIIISHNKKILTKVNEKEEPCNCKKKDQCPMKGSRTSCRTQNVIYRAEVTTEKEERKTYIGLTSMEFKKRISKHKMDFEHRKYKESTKLSNYI